MNILRENILDKIKKNLKETAKTERAYHACKIGLENMKKDFFESIRDIIKYKTKYEITKRQNMEENNFQDYNVIESNEIKITSALKIAKEKEKKYINCIRDTNIMQEEYIEIKKKNLNQFQSLEEELGINLKDSLRKFVIFKISYLRNLQYDLDKKAKLIENINIRKDIFDYIIKNSTNVLPPTKSEYSMYILDINKNSINFELNQDIEIFNEVKAYITNSFNLKTAKEIMEAKNEKWINIENLAFFDPCMGSGHILVYAFDVFFEIYKELGYLERDIPKLILKNNIFGLDIDDRAYQLAYFAVLMKARKYDRKILKKGIVPNVYAVQESGNISDSVIEFIQSCYETEKIRYIDFTRGDEKYKFIVGGKTHYIHSLSFTY